MKFGAFERVVGIVVGLCSTPCVAQETTSAPLAKQLAAALDAAKLDSIAARDPADPAVYVSALYLPGIEFLTIAAQYPAAELLNTRIAKKEFKDVYIELNGAGQAKEFVEDVACDGLKARREANQGADSFEAKGKRTTFDGDWKRQKLSESEYMEVFSVAEQRYAQILKALLDQLNKSGTR